MKKQTIRVEPLSTYAETRKVPISMAVRGGDFIFVSTRKNGRAELLIVARTP